MNEIDSTHGQEYKPVPQFFRDIFDGISAEQIAVQMYRETIQGNYEMVWIALQALRSKGDAGKQVLKHLAAGSDKLSAVARTLYEEPKTSADAIEKMLGIQRWGTVIPFSQKRGVDFSQIHAYAVAHGYTTMSAREMYEQHVHEAHEGPSHLRGTLGQVVFSGSRTVGSHLPTYFELMGPISTLRLRMREEPTALLLGTYGPYSSDDFGAMMRSINTDSEVHVIDINRTYTTQAEMSTKRTGKHHVLNADARDVQYPDNYFNIIATNYLFNFLGPDDIHAHGTITEIERDIQRIFENAFAMLQPGGIMLIVEDVYDVLKRSDGDGHITKNRILQIAKKVGFRFERQLPAALSTPLTKEWGLAKPGTNGFVDYRPYLIVGDESDIALKVSKPR